MEYTFLVTKTLELKTFVTLLIFSALIFLADSQRWLDPVKSVVQVVTNPVQYAIHSTKLAGQEAFSFLTFWKSGEARIRNLELRNLELLATKNEAERLKKENNELRQQLKVEPLSSLKQRPVLVLGINRYLEIGAGSEQGLKENQMVVYLDNLVGRIIKVTPKESFVQLPTDPDAKIPVKVGQARGLSLGQFNSSITLDRIAQTEEIKVDDLVFTLDNLVVGKITKITSKDTDLFQKAEIVPQIKFGNLSTVFVLE